MKIWTLAQREIAYRRGNFILSVLAVAAAAGMLLGQTLLLNAHDRRTDTILQTIQKQTALRVAAAETQAAQRNALLNDQMRKIMKKLGFNVWILPQNQNLSDFYSDGYASKFMPESYVHKLANSRLVSVRHLLPILEQKIRWTEQGDRKILLIGTRGEVPIIHKTPLAPLLQPVKKGEIVLGYELWKPLGLKVGQSITLLGKPFIVARLHNERGTKDDISAWIDLHTAQGMLNKAGKINAILALQCRCAWADLAKVRKEITSVLPDTQIKEIHTRAIARAEARQQAALLGQKAIEDIKAQGRAALAAAQADRQQLRGALETFAQVILPMILLGGLTWVAVLTLLNVRQRRKEIGVLRAIGLAGRQIRQLFLLRSLLIGGVGGLLGVFAAVAVCRVFEPNSFTHAEWWMLPAIVGGAIVCSALASLPPAAMAGRHDPATILSEE